MPTLTWESIETDSSYPKDPALQGLVRERYFNEYVKPTQEFKDLPKADRNDFLGWFFKDDAHAIINSLDEEKKTVPYERGLLGETASMVARGGLDLAEAVGGALRMTDWDPSQEKGILADFGKKITDASEWARETYDIFKPSIGETKEGFVRSGVMSGVRSTPVSLSTLGGAALGGLLGALTPIPGGALIGATIGGAGTLFATFGVGEYQNSYDENKKALLAQGLPADEVERKSKKHAFTSAFANTFGELAGDAASMFFFGLLPVGKAIKQPLKQTIKEIMGPSGKTYAKALAKSMPFEVGSEMWTAYTEAESARDIGISDVSPWKSAGESVIPAAVLSIIFGAGAHGINVVQARTLYQDLNSADRQIRENARDVISSRIKDPEEKKIWTDTANSYIGSDKEIPLSKPIIDFAIQKRTIDLGTAGSEGLPIAPPVTPLRTTAERQRYIVAQTLSTSEQRQEEINRRSSSRIAEAQSVDEAVAAFQEATKPVAETEKQARIADETARTAQIQRDYFGRPTTYNEPVEGRRAAEEEALLRVRQEPKALPTEELIRAGDMAERERRAAAQVPIGPIEAERRLKEAERLSLALDPYERRRLEQIVSESKPTKPVGILGAATEGLKRAEAWVEPDYLSPVAWEEARQAQGKRNIQQFEDKEAAEKQKIKDLESQAQFEEKQRLFLAKQAEEAKKISERLGLETKKDEGPKPDIRPRGITPPSLTVEDIDRAANEAATSPENEKPEPTPDQISAGNYPLGHFKWNGLEISIENPKGSVRTEKKPENAPADWKPRWRRELTHNYGYIRGTEDTGDGKLDVFVGPNPESQKVFVVDQINPETGKFDEWKALAGFNNMDQAKEGYLSNYEKGWKGLGAITEIPVEEFKEWATRKNRAKKPIAYKEKENAAVVRGKQGSDIQPEGKGVEAEKPEEGDAGKGPKETLRQSARDRGEDLYQPPQGQERGGEEAPGRIGPTKEQIEALRAKGYSYDEIFAMSQEDRSRLLGEAEGQVAPEPRIAPVEPAVPPATPKAEGKKAQETKEEPKLKAAEKPTVTEYTQEQLESVEVEIKAVKEDTRRIYKIKERADKALKDIDAQIEQYYALLECVS